MFVLGQGVPSPHGVRFIISIHQGFMPFQVEKVKMEKARIGGKQHHMIITRRMEWCGIGGKTITP